MKRSIILLHFLLLFVFHTYAQTYWQQTVNTIIGVTLDDKNNFLRAYEEITYINNSPDTLSFIYLHLWPNAYDNDRTPFAQQMDAIGDTRFYYSNTSDRGYIDSLQFDVDGQSVDYKSADNAPDIARIDLPTPLIPGKQIRISTPFRVKIPLVFSRLGHSGQAYYISQWFPKPAVYDHKGWHPFSFLEQGEFYSEYGSYDITITLPKNYVLLATGNCTNNEENKWLDSLAAVPLNNYSDTVDGDNFPPSSYETKSIHFHEDKVHDFAWFADKRWIVRKDTVTSPGTGNIVTTYAAFLPRHKTQWEKATGYLAQTVKHYGDWVGPYPFKTIKAVEGDMHAGGGMEYPTITIIDKSSYSVLSSTIIHEGGHNWFYSMLGSNERDHAWMDEGINTFFEQKTSNDIKAQDSNYRKPNKPTYDINDLLYFQAVATHTDQAIDQTSANFTKLNYGSDVYYKTAMMLRWLEDYMGEDDFEKGIHDYYSTWKFKHPYPEDFRACMQKSSPKSLDWFFDGMLNTDKKIDYKIKALHHKGNSYSVTIKNKGRLAGPAYMDVYNGNSKLHSSSSEPFTGQTSVSFPDTIRNWDRINIDNDIPDAKTANNIYTRYGLSHNCKFRLRPILGLNRSYFEKAFWSPAFGYNTYDGFMLGAVLHDLTIPENRFRFVLVPMVGLSQPLSFAGAGSIGYLWYPDNLFKQIILQADAKTFRYADVKYNSEKLYVNYQKLAPSLEITFNEHNLLSPVTRTLLLKAYSITEQNFYYTGDSTTQPEIQQQQKMYGLLRYTHKNNRAYNPFNYSIEGQLGVDFAKVNIEGNLRIDYFKKNKAFYVRAYAGKFISINNDPAVTQRYYLSATFTGLNDYLYDGTYYGRTATDGSAAQQTSMQEGGFKVITRNSIGRSDNYLLALNLKSDLPIKLPIRLFADIGTYTDPTINNGNAQALFDGGIEVHSFNDFVTVNIPLLMSSNFYNYLGNTFGAKNIIPRSISFCIKLNNVNWLKTPSEILRSSIQ
jgi:hypothetical protein